MYDEIKIRKNPIYNDQTINFKNISQPDIKKEVKKAIYRHLEYESLATVQDEMTIIRNFSHYLEQKWPKISSCLEIDRKILEEYLIYRMTENESDRSGSTYILRLRAVLESIGKIYHAPHLEKLFINTDIPPELDPEFRVYSDGEIKRLMACITKLDEQIARCMVIHQMLGTRISDTLTLKMGCLSKANGHDMIRIEQVKTRVYEKPISRELVALIEKAMEYTAEKYGKFVDIKLVLTLLAAKLIPLPACGKGFFIMFAYTHIAVFIREHEGKAHLHHDEQGMEIPHDNRRILFKRNPVSRGYAAESGNALTVQAACLFVNCIIIHVIKETCHKGKSQSVNSFISQSYLSAYSFCNSIATACGDSP